MQTHHTFPKFINLNTKQHNNRINGQLTDKNWWSTRWSMTQLNDLKKEN